jgi:prepilin-type processing-associated H-X9-DG protein
MRKYIIGLLLSFVVCLPGTALALSIVAAGKPAAALVVAAEAPPMVRYAADEFRQYLERSSGAALPVVTSAAEVPPGLLRIYIGGSPETGALGLSVRELGYDGFKIASGPDWLALVGRDSEPCYGVSHPLRIQDSYNSKLKLSRFGETGTLFAVYYFLEQHCGMRWFMPGALGEVVPVQRSISVPQISVTREPDFEYRNMYFNDFPTDHDGARWFRRAGFGGPAISINHSFSRIKSKYRETNPEFFAIYQGERDYELTCMGRGNLCLSEPGLIQAWVRDIREFFDQQPQQLIYPVMPNDGYRTSCECERCAAFVQAQEERSGSRPQAISNYVWNFVNQIALEVYKTHPDRLIGCCAYSQYINPPDNLEKLSPNVAVMVCKTRRNYWDQEYQAKINQFLDGWRTKARQLYIWEYYLWVGYEPILKGLPVFFPYILAQDIRSLKGSSRGEFIESGTWRPRSDDPRLLNLPGLSHLNLYLTGKLLWEAEADVEAILNDYYQKFYGPAESEMRQFWTLAAELWSSRRKEHGSAIYQNVYREENIDRLLALLAQGRQRCQPGSPECQRIELLQSEMQPVKERVQKVRVINPPELSLPQAGTAPRLDGLLDDELWSTAARSDLVNNLGGEADYRSELLLSWGQGNLYLALRNYEPNLPGMRALARGRDQRVRPVVYEDEAVEIFINPDPLSDRVYYQFVINTVNALWDSRNVVGEPFAPQAWDSKMQSATSIQADHWVLELQIPLADLGLENFSGGRIKANIFRNRVNDDREGMVYSGWSPTLANRHHLLDRFGTLVLAGREGASAAPRTQDAAGQQFQECYESFRLARAGDRREGNANWPSYPELGRSFQSLAATKVPALAAKAAFYAGLCFFLEGAYTAAADCLQAIPALLGPGQELSWLAEVTPEQVRGQDFAGELPGIFSRGLANPNQRQQAEALVQQLQMLRENELQLQSLQQKLLPERTAAAGNRLESQADCNRALLYLGAGFPLFALSLTEIQNKLAQAICVGNMRLIGIALRLYARENGRIPEALTGRGRGSWHALIIPYTDGPGTGWKNRSRIWRCPAAPADGYSYGLNNLLHHLYRGQIEAVPQPGNMVLLADSIHYQPGTYPHQPLFGGGAYSIRGRLEHSGGGTIDRARHDDGANVLFVDGSVSWLPVGQLPVPEGVFWRGQEQ